MKGMLLMNNIVRHMATAALLLLLLAALPAVSHADDQERPVRVQMPLVEPGPEPDRPLGVRKDAGALRLGPMQIHPFLSAKETYSDNIFYTPTDKKHDFYTTLTPGVYLEVPVRAHALALTASTTLIKHSRFSSENTTDYYLGGQGVFSLGSLITLKLDDAFTKSHEPRSDSSTGIIEKYRRNEASASLTYRLAEVSKVQLDYTHTNWNYKTSGFRSRSEDLVAAYLYYRMLPKTSAFVEFDFKNVNFDDSTTGLDNKVISGLLGLAWEFTQRSRGTIKAGYLSKEFDQESKGRLRTWTASADISHDFSDFTTVKLVAKRDVNESNYLGTRYFVTTGLYSEVMHRFLDRLAGVARASYGEDKYSDTIPGDTATRKDRTASVGLGARYFMQRWLEFVLDYNYRKRDSNIARYDYNENAFTLTANASF